MPKTSAIARWGPLARLRARWSRWDTVLLVSSLVLLAGAGLPLPGYSVGPGPIRTVDELITISGGEVFAPSGEVLMATVALHPLTPFRALQAWLDSNIETVQPDDVVSTQGRARDMEDSRDAASTVALQRLGRLGLEPDGQATVEIRAAGVDGNSAGLAFTLAILDLLTPGPLTGGRRIGVTGTIERDGDVGPVGSVDLKAVAMRQAGVEHL
ncbi:MAG TPA: S16 family serine protease, partial [Acidimicrobiales bacterium]|nr:S16 family serine protease [Acidimicrobiales bacterium]